MENEKGSDSNENFKGLVSGISSDERQDLLDKIQKENQTAGSSSSQNQSFLAEDSNDIKFNLRLKLNQEPLLHRFFLWLKSIFTSTSIEEVYNKSLLSATAREVDRENPGLIDPFSHSFTAIFYDMLTPIKTAQSLFQPFVDAYQSDPNSYIHALGELILQEYHQKIKKDADPYIYPTDKELSKETRGNLLHRMTNIIDNIPAEKKAEMYASVKYMEWLKQLCSLPITKTLQYFNSTDGMKSCPYIQLRNDFRQIANVLSGRRVHTEELLIATYQFAENMNVFEILNREPLTKDQFIEKASSELSLVSSFIDDVPMEKLARLVYGDSQFTLNPVVGGEDWFARYKAHWKVLFDRRWDAWTRDLRLHDIKNKLDNYFEIPTIPVFQYRPWHLIWGGVKFNYDMTLGFLAYFFKNLYPNETDVLKTLSLEGEFVIKENRMEFTDVINTLAAIDDEIQILGSQLAPGGDYGQEFFKCENRGQGSQTARTHVKEMIGEIEDRVSNLIAQFGKSCRSLENLMSGIMSEKISAAYGPLLNLTKIRAHDNKHFIEEIHKCRFIFEHALEIVKELEVVDMPGREA